LQYAFSKDIKLKSSFGLFHQFINQLEHFGEQGLNARTDFWVLSKPETGSQLKATKAALGVVYEPKNWLLDLEVYYNNTSGISSASSVLNMDGLIEGTGNSEVFGLGVLLKRKWNNFNFWINHTLSRNIFKSPSSSFGDFPSNNDQRHNLRIYNTYTWKKWNFSLSYSYKTGLPFSVLTGITQVTSEENPIVVNQLTYDELNNRKLGDYSRIDFGVAYRTKLFTDKTNLDARVSILNLLNTKNSFSKAHFISDTESMSPSQINSIETFQLQCTPQFSLRFYW